MARRARATAKAHADKTEKTAKADKADNDDASRERGTATRGVWSGSISFGLLQIPVTLFTGERRSEEIHFRQLDKSDLSPIRYERLSSSTGKPVAWKDIVKGYEYEPDTFVVLDPAELEKANAKATHTIDIQDFVPADQIDPAFFETPYYLVPEKRAAKAYVLLRNALAKKEAVAVATFVLRTREHLCALMPVGDALMLEVLRFGHELRAPKELHLPSGKETTIGARELRMAEQLIDGMMTEWEPSKYRDRYSAEVMAMIEEKAKTGTVKTRGAKAPGEVATDVVDLLDLLKKSVAAKRGGHAHANDATAASAKKRARGPGPKKAASTRGAARKKHEAA